MAAKLKTLAQKRQKHLPRMAPPSIKAIDKAAEKYVDVKRERFAMVQRYADCRANLIAAMKEHKLTHYEFDGYAVDIDDKAEVHVKKKKEPKASSNGDGQDQ